MQNVRKKYVEPNPYKLGIKLSLLLRYAYKLGFKTPELKNNLYRIYSAILSENLPEINEQAHNVRVILGKSLNPDYFKILLDGYLEKRGLAGYENSAEYTKLVELLREKFSFIESIQHELYNLKKVMQISGPLGIINYIVENKIYKVEVYRE